MLIRKSDIGGEILSILTRGMYLDPKDALREYVQNGVDAKATDISIKIRQDTIVIADNGEGMDKNIMRRSVRVGISEKNLSQNVGFMGIGIYSSFHLCDELNIYSRKKDNSPCMLTFNFKQMREILEKQRELRFSTKINEDQLIALQDLLENNINLEEISLDEFPKVGTRVELLGIEPTFFKSLSKFEEVADYLEQVVPLPFNPKFKFGREIHSYIHQICKDYNVEFSLVNLELQINDEKETLYRPYQDEYFDPEPLEPKFYLLKSKGDFFGIAWGCLNKSKNTIKNKTRGFIIKKQGFTIGDRSDLLPYFNRQTFYNRYIGEVIVVHPKLLPNASRSEFEYTPLRIDFQTTLRDMAGFYNRYGNVYQEELKSREILNDAITFLKSNKAQYEFHLDNSEKLFEILWEAKEYPKRLRSKKSQKRFSNDDLQKANEVIKQLDAFAKEIKDLIEQNKKKKKPTRRKTETEIATDISNVPEESNETPVEKFESLSDVIDSLGLDIPNEIMLIFELLDENYIRAQALDNDDYKRKLLNLKDNFEELLEE